MGSRRRFYMAAFLAAILIILAVSCAPMVETASPSPVQSVKNINVAEADALIQANAGNPDFIIIDVRTPEEFAAGHLENAVLVDYRAGNFNEEIGKFDRSKEYLIYCRTGNRSSGARDIMKEMGFLNINHMDGGITAWLAEGLPVAK